MVATKVETVPKPKLDACEKKNKNLQASLTSVQNEKKQYFHLMNAADKSRSEAEARLDNAQAEMSKMSTTLTGTQEELAQEIKRIRKIREMVLKSKDTWGGLSKEESQAVFQAIMTNP